jgi:flagellar assembly protein FliH
VRLYVNPQDFEQVKSLRERHEESWRIVEDEALLPGGCRVETEHSRIDASMETRIAQAMDQLSDQLHEQSLHPAAADLGLDLGPLTPSAPQSDIAAPAIDPDAAHEPADPSNAP